jgi:antitoxin HicB
MFAYPATIKADRKDGGFVVTFRDIPEAITQGEDMEDALRNAKDALETAMQFYFDDRREVPMPSSPHKGERLVGLPASEGMKILLLNEMVRQQVKPSELAKRMHTSKQDVNRITTLKHATKVDAIENAFHALDRELTFGVVAV